MKTARGMEAEGGVRRALRGAALAKDLRSYQVRVKHQGYGTRSFQAAVLYFSA